MRDVFDIYTIIFLALAVFIFLRLRSVLGQRTGRERPPYDPYTRRDGLPARGGDKVVDMPRRVTAAPPAAPAVAVIPMAQKIGAVAAEGSAVSDGLKAIAPAKC